MTRGKARELAVHLIYAREFTGEEPEAIIAARLEKEYYSQLSQENQVYEERPSRAQRAYIDSVVSGVANRLDELNEIISKFAIGWDISRISRLSWRSLRSSVSKMCPPAWRFRKLSVLSKCMTETMPDPLLMVFWVHLPEVFLLR